MTSEFAIIERLRRILPQSPPGETWIGDDAAVVASPEGVLLLSTDAAVAGVHGDLSLVGLDDFGWKALTAAVSDIAAMGGRPRHALVTVAGPPEVDLELLYQGLAEAASTWACPVVGGDLANAPVLVVSVSVEGGIDGAPVLRSGARAGDTLMVTGPLGAAALGLRLLREGGGRDRAAAAEVAAIQAHRRPAAEVDGGVAARVGGATAMIDVSDGLAADLGHLADESGVGIDLAQVPVADGATLSDALHGGEDYALVFSAPDPAAAAAAFAAADRPRPVVIGRCTADAAQRSLDGRPLPEGGWEHHWR
jgi:thiamine-monophosphate kinase